MYEQRLQMEDRQTLWGTVGQLRVNFDGFQDVLKRNSDSLLAAIRSFDRLAFPAQPSVHLAVSSRSLWWSSNLLLFGPNRGSVGLLFCPLSFRIILSLCGWGFIYSRVISQCSTRYLLTTPLIRHLTLRVLPGLPALGLVYTYLEVT